MDDLESTGIDFLDTMVAQKAATIVITGQLLTIRRLQSAWGIWIDLAIAARIAAYKSPHGLQCALADGRIRLRTRVSTSGKLQISAASLGAYLQSLAQAAEGGPM